MRAYLRQIFVSCPEEEGEWSCLEKELDEFSEGQLTVTVVRSSGMSHRRDIPSQICLCAKADNRRKHNSAVWILSPSGGFAFGSDYVLLTDCGTLFTGQCVTQLVSYMMDHPRCNGCTARPRIMSGHEQDETSFSLLGWLFRVVQMAEYEASYASSVAAFAWAGMLPVLPGPCTMLRYDALVGLQSGLFDNEEESRPLVAKQKSVTPFEHFEHVLETPAHETGVVLENLKLAEDRVPSYACVTHATGNQSELFGAYTTWVSGFGSFGPVVKLQAETDVKSWITQRRRWINGAMAA